MKFKKRIDNYQKQKENKLINERLKRLKKKRINNEKRQER